MRKIFYQWAAVGILSLVGWGVDVMPGNTSWIPSAILWGIAGVWFIATLVYLIKHRYDIGHNGKENASTSLEGIKSGLITLNTQERYTATLQAKALCSKETAMQIYNDFTSIFGANVVSTIKSILQEIVRKDSVDPLVTFFKKFGDILDNNGYGLKTELENNSLYKSSRADLAQKRVKLKMGQKKKHITQKNIDRVRLLSYGLSSSVLLRSVLDSEPKVKEIVPSVIRITLEGIETMAEETLNTMLNDLENEWKISKENKDGIESALAVLSAMEGIQ